MIATEGTTSTLLFGFGTFIITRIDAEYEFLPYASRILILATNYEYSLGNFLPFGVQKREILPCFSDTIFFLGGQIDERSIQQWESVGQETLRRRMVRNYIRCNRVNNESNTSKAKIITVAQILLLIGLVLIPFILV